MGAKKSLSFNIALGGLMSALGVALMFMTGLIPASMYIFPAVAGLLVWVAADNTTPKWGLLCYGASAMITLLIVPDPEARMMFVFLLGYYPMLKIWLNQRVRLFIFRLVIEVAVFTISSVSAYWIILTLFAPKYLLDQIGEFGQYGLWIFYLMGLGAFLIYDFGLSQMFFAYEKWLKPKVKKRL